MLNEITKIVDQAKSLVNGLECDGSTRVMVYLLTQAHVKFDVMVGYIGLGDYEFDPHFWIETRIDNATYIIDLKSKMWLGDDADEGIFKKTETKTEYDGHPIQMKCDQHIFSILTMSSQFNHGLSHGN